MPLSHRGLVLGGARVNSVSCWKWGVYCWCFGVICIYRYLGRHWFIVVVQRGFERGICADVCLLNVFLECRHGSAIFG